MMNQALGGLIGLNNQNMANVPDAKNQKPQQPLQQETPQVQGGHLDVQSMIKSVFSGNTNKGNLPTGYIGS